MRRYCHVTRLVGFTGRYLGLSADSKSFRRGSGGSLVGLFDITGQTSAISKDHDKQGELVLIAFEACFSDTGADYFVIYWQGVSWLWLLFPFFNARN